MVHVWPDVMWCCVSATCTNVVFPEPAMPRQMMHAFFLLVVLSFAAPTDVLGGMSALSLRLSGGAVCLRSAVEEMESVSIPSAILYLDWKWDQVEHARNGKWLMLARASAVRGNVRLGLERSEGRSRWTERRNVSGIVQ